MLNYKNADLLILRPQKCEKTGAKNSTGLITILEPRDQEIGKFCVVQERHETDFKAKKSGSPTIN